MTLFKRRSPSGPMLVALADIEAQLQEMIDQLKKGPQETRPIRALCVFNLKESLKNLRKAARHRSEW